MTRFASHIVRATLLGAAALLAACSSDSTAPQRPQDDAAARAAQTFSDLSDSVTRNGGDPQVGQAYGAIAGLLRTGGRVTPVTIAIDGVATPFVATATSFETSYAPCDPVVCDFMPVAQRTLVAWAEDDPTRIVQLSSTSNDEPVGIIPDPTLLASWAPMASLVYMDGHGGVFAGTSGTQRFAVTKSATPCPIPEDSLSTVLADPFGSCVLADVAVTLDASAAPTPFVLSSNSAAGTHTIAMAQQTVAGTHREFVYAPCDTLCSVPGSPGGPLPPVVIQPSDQLPATLTAAVGASVSLTLTVSNPTSSPMQVTYASGQRYDFAVTDSTTGLEVWRWSMGKGFTQSVGTETIPAGGSVTYTESWTPPKRGLYLAHGYLTSTSHRADAYASVVIP